MSQIVALDVEMIVLNNCEGRDKMAAALVVVAGEPCGEILYSNFIYYPRKIIDLRSLSYTSRFVNGIRYADIYKKGISLKKVQMDLCYLLKDKKVIVCGGLNDFYSLGLNSLEFNVFDLHSHFWKYSYDGRPQPIGLRSLVFHYFHKDIHKGIHNPIVDAQETLRLYTSIVCEHTRKGTKAPFKQIMTIK